MVFIGINPSTADENKDDRTITRLIGFCKLWGYGSFTIVNLFPVISANKDYLLYYRKKPCYENCQHRNLDYIKYFKLIEADVVFMWGKIDAKLVDSNVRKVINWFPNAKCFKKNKDKSPIHPLYLPYSVKLIPFSGNLEDKMEYLSNISFGKLELKKKMPLMKS